MKSCLFVLNTNIAKLALMDTSTKLVHIACRLHQIVFLSAGKLPAGTVEGPSMLVFCVLLCVCLCEVVYSVDKKNDVASEVCVFELDFLCVCVSECVYVCVCVYACMCVSVCVCECMCACV